MSTSVSKSPARSKPQSSNHSSNRSARKWIIGSATILMLLTGFFVIRTQGYVSGVEFSPSNFQTRDFSFYEIPLLHVQITPIKRTVRAGKSATYLRQKSLIPASPTSATTWHLVQISRGLTGQTPADASLLVDQLLIQSGGDEHWRKWSIDHPKLATVLWPHVQKLADRELYILIPSLFEMVSASRDWSPEDLQSSIDGYLSRQYVDLVADMTAAGRDQLAADFLAEARADYPENKELAEIHIAGSEAAASETSP